MSGTTAGRSLLTFAIASFATINLLADWNRTHVFNPTWPPHARFHAADMSMIVWGVSAIAIWLLWRQSTEPEVAVKVALLISIALWSPFLYITLIVPGTSLYVGGTPTVVQHSLAGMMIEPQVVLAILFLPLSAWGYRLAIRPNSR
jgi:uncharacterized protein DUF6640